MPKYLFLNITRVEETGAILFKVMKSIKEYILFIEYHNETDILRSFVHIPNQLNYDIK